MWVISVANELTIFRMARNENQNVSANSSSNLQNVQNTIFPYFFPMK